MKKAALVIGLLLFPVPGFAVCSLSNADHVRFIVPNSVGGGYDRYSRTLAPYLGEALNVSIRVENIPEAGGIVGSAKIRDAKPDGSTLGILNGPGLMIASLVGQEGIPDPATDFTILGRIARSEHIWVAATDSSLKTMNDVYSLAKQRPIVFATRDIASMSFLSITVGADVLDFDVEAVAGYAGRGERTLALLRGEVDLISANFSSILKELHAGEFQPLLQISEASIADSGNLNDIPVIGGASGLAAQVDRNDPKKVQRMTAALVKFIGAGRLIAAPSGIQPQLRACLRKAVLSALTEPGFIADAKRARLTLNVAGGEQAEMDLNDVKLESEAFKSIVSEALERLRQ